MIKSEIVFVIVIAHVHIFGFGSLITKITKHGRWSRKEMIEEMISPLLGFIDRQIENFLWSMSHEEKEHVRQCLLRNKLDIKYADRKQYSCSVESITVCKGIIIFVDICVFQ